MTTIAWRAAHVGRDVLGKRARAFFGGSTAPDDADMYDDRHWPQPLPDTAAGALALLDEAYSLWHTGVARLDDAALQRLLGPRGGPYANDSMARLVLHVNREVMAHGAEICLLRDLYRADRDRRDPVVAAARRGDAAGMTAALLEGAGQPRASLLTEAAGLHHWDVVRALVDAGVSSGHGAPSALHYAAAAGELAIVRLLVAHDADVSARDEQFHATPAEWAEVFGHPHVAAHLRSVPQDASPDGPGDGSAARN